MEKIHGIYVPGLGDDQPLGQDKVIERLFPLFGLEIDYHTVTWRNGDWQTKEDKLSEHITDLYNQFGRIVLIGSSAGASAILNAGAQNLDKVAAFVYLCGKIQNPYTLDRVAFDENPAFEQSLNKLPKSINKIHKSHSKNVLSLKPLWDKRVPVRDTKIGFGKEVTMPVGGHVTGIGFGLVFYPSTMARFVRNANRHY